MSYSFNVRESSKEAAVAKVAEKMNTIVEQQPAHAADRDQAVLCAEQFIAVLSDNSPTAQDIVVDMHGSLSISVTGIQQANVSISARLADPLPG